MNTAKLLKNNLPNFNGHAALYKLNPPLKDYSEKEHEFVVVSSAEVPFSGPETYIFPANENGKVTSWGELECSERGVYDHATALGNAGYKIV